MNSGAHVSSIITRSYAPVPSRIDSLSFWYRFAFGSEQLDLGARMQLVEAGDGVASLP